MSARVPLSTWLAVAGFSALWIMLGAIVVPESLKHDFLSFYTGATMARDGNFQGLYDVQAQWAQQRAIVPDAVRLVPFIRIPSYATLLSPLSFLPLTSAFVVWLSLQISALFGIWYWCRRQWGGDALILCSVFLPTTLGIAHGQDCVWIAGLIAGIYGFSQKRDSMAAGLFLGLGFVKFHLFLLWPLALLMEKRWRTIAGAALMVAGQVVFSLAVAGWSGFMAYASLLRNKELELLNPSPELMINVQGLAINAGVKGSWLPALLIALTIGLTAAACWKAPLWRWISAATAGSLLITPHTYGYDASLLLVPLIACSFEAGVPKYVRLASVALLAPLVFFATLGGVPWAGITPLALLLFLVGLASSAVASLPMYDLRSKQPEPAS